MEYFPYAVLLLELTLLYAVRLIEDIHIILGFIDLFTTSFIGNNNSVQLQYCH